MTIPQESGQVKPAAEGGFVVQQTSPLEDLGVLQRELRSLVHDQLRLVALEFRLATQSLMSMITAAVFIGALLVLAWVGLMGAAGLGLIGLGLAPPLVLLVLTALTVIPALLLGAFVRHRSRDLGFPATLRTLKPSAPGAGDRESAC
jgi:Putative Actinobacterial Holin-X, holin superfamily III